LQWMRLGDPSMYIALVAMAFYMALYWVVFMWISRTAVHRVKVPFALAVPIIWVGLDLLRSHLLTGFSWYFVGHTQYRWVELIQISDLFGSYGVTFIVVLANAALALLIPVNWLTKWDLIFDSEVSEHQTLVTSKARVQSALAACVIVIAAVGYGYARRSGDFEAGPRVALIQGNFTASLKPDQDQWGEMYYTHHTLTGATVKYQPDLVVWPEAMFRFPMFDYKPGMTDEELKSVHPQISLEAWKSRQSQEKLAEMSEMTNAAMCIGINTYWADLDGFHTYNSAAFVTPESGVDDVYHKIHRVPFGEYIPFKNELPFIQAATPFRGDWGLTAGKSIHIFQADDYRYVPLICFEDTVPHLVTKMVAEAERGERELDCLVNLTNDGWFHGSSELDQHLITALFRCVETRTPMARAVNTGISAIIDGDGVIREPAEFIDLDASVEQRPAKKSMRDPKTGKFHRQLNCAIVGDIPLDHRRSLYVKFGDWFASGCLIIAIAVALRGVLIRPDGKK